MIHRMLLSLLIPVLIIQTIQPMGEKVAIYYPDSHMDNDYKCFSHYELSHDPVPDALMGLHEEGDPLFNDGQMDDPGVSVYESPLKDTRKRRIAPCVNQQLRVDARQAKKRPCRDYGWQPLETALIPRDHKHPRLDNIFYWLLASDENVGSVRDLIKEIDMRGHPKNKALIFLKQTIRFGAQKNMQTLLGHKRVQAGLQTEDFVFDALITAAITNQRDSLRTLLEHTQPSSNRSKMVAYVRRFSHLTWADRKELIDILVDAGADPNTPQLNVPSNRWDWLYVKSCQLLAKMEYLLDDPI